MGSLEIFVACGKQDVDQAQTLVDRLEDAMPNSNMRFWHKPGVFGLSEGVFEELIRTADSADFAVIIMLDPPGSGNGAGDHHQRLQAISPNVMFELGLFYGRLERYRTIIVSTGQDLPADLEGVLVVRLDGHDGGDDAGIDDAVSKIVAQVRKHGPRIPPTFELGSLERMLNVCTPDHRDYQTPHLKNVQPHPDERFDTAADFFDLCRALLRHYVISSMTPDQAGHIRAYFAVYLGDTISVRVEEESRLVRRCAAHGRGEVADSTFLIASSNPWDEVGDSGESLAPGLLKVHWRLARGITGFEADDPSRPMSNCARAFAEQRELAASIGERHNQDVDDEQRAFSVPVLWCEGHHTASVGVLGLSMDSEGARLDNDNLLGRLRLVSNVLGVAAGRLARVLRPPVDMRVGIRTQDPELHRSFVIRAVELRRGIGRHVVEQLLREGELEIRQESDEAVVARSSRSN